MGDTAGATRVYRGLTGDERLADRRRRLLDAALDLFGTRGYPGTRIEDLCSHAGVATRHFYEAFAGRERLLIELYDELIEEHFEALRIALEADEARLERFVQNGVLFALVAWTADPRKARIAFVEVVGAGPEAERHRLASIRRYAALLARQLERFGVPGPQAWWSAHALVGAVSNVLAIWVEEDDPPSVPEVAERIGALFARGLVSGA